MKHAFLSRRHRNPHQHDEQQKEQPFFSKSNDTESQPFFSAASHGESVQTKLAIGQPGDKYEREADAVADHVVNGENQTAVQRQDIGAIQRADLATPREEEKPSTAEARMEKDRLLQRKPEAQMKPASTEEKKEKPVQMQAAPTGTTEEKKEKPVQMQAAPTGATAEKKEKPVQMQAAPTGTTAEKKEKPVQMQAAPTGATAEKKEKPVQMQAAPTGTTAEKKEKPVQMQAAPTGTTAEKKEKPVQMQAAPAGATEEKKEKPVQMQAAPAGATEEKKEKPVQMQAAPAGATEEKKKKAVQMQPTGKPEEEKKVQTEATPGAPRQSRKAESDRTTASRGLGRRLRDSLGKGNALPRKARAEMESAMGTNFSGVNIHTDAAAVQMNEELGAQAFTHGQDVYFNSGKYRPESSDGKRLLAHELTHVVQQTGEDVRLSKEAVSPPQREPAYREFQPVVTVNDTLVYARMQDMPENFRTRIMSVLRYYGIDYQVDDKTQKVLVHEWACGDMHLLWHYTSRANDSKWMAAHASSV